MMGSNRQQTQAKAARERTLRERRERKLAKKQAAAAERKERAVSVDVETSPSPLTDEPELRSVVDETLADDGALGPSTGRPGAERHSGS